MKAVEWQISDTPVGYEETVAAMEARVTEIQEHSAAELVWLLEHPALYTAGTGARPEDLLDGSLLPVRATGRGGKYTYHGPGQRVAYVMLDLRERGRDVRRHVNLLEEWLIRALERFNVVGERREGRVGIWIDQGGRREAKIAAVGVRVRHWITYHGVSLNIEPDLDHYRGIVPCGIGEYGVTSLVDLGIPVTTAEVDLALMDAFGEVFGPQAAIVDA
ncbi:MAG: lipoyl(octanoyl) transferase LipB [Alphaproteobacteria bacterium]|nr:lipoyl(octanoyl) transferase LipB [Alphaproteobacteria bacterium]